MIRWVVVPCEAGFRRDRKDLIFGFDTYRQVSRGRCLIVYVPLPALEVLPDSHRLTGELVCLGGNGGIVWTPSLALVDSSTVFGVPSMAS